MVTVPTDIDTNTYKPLNIKIKHGRLELRKSFFSIRVIEEWNKIPADLKNSPTREGFKKKYKELGASMMYHT